MDARLPHRPPRISKSCLSQPAWTTTPKRTEHNLIVRSGKYEAEVTSNRKLRTTYCTNEANYRHIRSIGVAGPLRDSRATCSAVHWTLDDTCQPEFMKVHNVPPGTCHPRSNAHPVTCPPRSSAVSRPPPRRTQYTTPSMWTNVQCEVPILSSALIYYIKRGGQYFFETGTNPCSWPYPIHEAGSWPYPTHVDEGAQLIGGPLT